MVGYLLVAAFLLPLAWAVLPLLGARGREDSDRRLAARWPWTDGTGRPWRGWARLPLAAPFVLGYLVVSWALFVPAAEREGNKWKIDEAEVGAYVYRIPDLTADFSRALRSLATAPFLNHDSLQLVYVTGLLLLFGVAFEAREGTLKTAILFFGTSFAGAVAAGVLLQVVYPDLVDGGVWERAWERTWSGGSAGAFGLMGALAGRARRPGPLLLLFVVWELNIAYWNLRSYTPAFHLTALAVGCLATRYGLSAVRDAARPTGSARLAAFQNARRR